MKSLNLGRYALSSCVAAALFAGCGESQPPIGAPGAMAKTAVSSTLPEHGAHMAPGTSSQALFYAVYGLGAYVVSYPEGQVVGTAQVSLPEQPCSDTQGDVYITSGLHAPGTIYEFAHGGTQPIRTLNDAYGVPYGCAVDPMTGDLAVANEGGVHGSPTGNLLVYKEAKGKPKVYNAPQYSGYFFCAYDDKGSLFANNSAVRLDKLVPGGSELRLVTIIKNPFVNIGPIQWDGQYVAITDSGRSAVYRLRVTGTTATVVGKTSLREWSQVAQTQSVIYQGVFITPTAHAGNKVGIWNYPAGGKRTATWDFTSNPLQGVTMSVAPSR